MNLGRYHEQHADIRQQADELQRRIEPARFVMDPGAARQALVTLGARLSIHLAFEDTALYLAGGIPLFWITLPRLAMAALIPWLERLRRRLVRFSFRAGTI